MASRSYKVRTHITVGAGQGKVKVYLPGETIQLEDGQAAKMPWAVEELPAEVESSSDGKAPFGKGGKGNK